MILVNFCYFNTSLKFGTFADVDECRENPNICQHGRCTNTPGGYRCDCSSGYVPSEDGKICVGQSVHVLINIQLTLKDSKIKHHFKENNDTYLLSIVCTHDMIYIYNLKDYTYTM